MKCAVAWSGGKDCSLALCKSLKEEREITHLVRIFDEGGAIRTHGIGEDILKAQSESLGIPIVLQRMPRKGNFGRILREALSKLHEDGVEGVIFGDLIVQNHRGWIKHYEWTQKTCKRLGMVPIQPLWGIEPSRVFAEFLNSGIIAIVTSVDARLFGKEWVGAPIDQTLGKFLTNREIDICGEAGEFHSLALDGPMFSKPVKYALEAVYKEGHYWKPVIKTVTSS